MKPLPLVLLWAARGTTVLCTLAVVSYAALVLASCGGSGQDTSQKGTTVIDQPKQEANCND